MMDLLKSRINRNVTVVVRGVHERTEQLCMQLLAAQINQKNIHLIHEVPFSLAVKKTFEIGLSEKRPWTLVVDADILVRSGALKDFYNRAARSPGSVFVLHSLMIDKFFGGARSGGLKLYRTEFLKEALELVPEVANRPEGSVAKKMHSQGFYLDITDVICGLHDFEQYYSDIFRKGFAHGIKHSTLLPVLLPYWQRMSSRDRDFKILLAGFNVAKTHKQDLTLDKDEVKTQFEKYMSKNRWREKTASGFRLTSENIDGLFNNFVPPPEYAAINAAIESLGRPQIPSK
jgi:hypothetical protein